jgi:hypothetical protein
MIRKIASGKIRQDNFPKYQTQDEDTEDLQDAEDRRQKTKDIEETIH